MTKQEEIKKIATTMCGFYNKGKCAFPEYESCDKFNSQECSYKEEAEELYYAGYRKADDVRKETAKVILYMLYDMGIDKRTLECCRIFDVNGVSLAKQICEKYDVEVEK